MEKFNLGLFGEKVAQQVYERKGYRIVGKNIFNRRGKRFGEIDFIAVSASELVFVEVKTRSQEDSKFGNIFESVDKAKRLKILKTVRWLLLNNQGWSKLIPRIDVCGIMWSNIDKQPEKVIIKSNAIEDFS